MCHGRSAVRRAAHKALELDPLLGEAHAALAFATFVYDWDWEGAERGFRQAIELSPNHAEAHGRYAIFLANMGRHEEARREVRLAQELDPLSSLMCQNLGMVLCLAREYDQAIDALLKTIEMDENHGLARSTLGLVYAETGMCEKAIEQVGLKVNPVVDKLRSDPRFADLLRRVGLVA